MQTFRGAQQFKILHVVKHEIAISRQKCIIKFRAKSLKNYFAMRAKVFSTEDEDMIVTKRTCNMQTDTFQMCICCACKSFLSNDYIDSSIVFDFSLCFEFAVHSKQDFNSLKFKTTFFFELAC